jgi:hypothetical protein
MATSAARAVGLAPARFRSLHAQSSVVVRGFALERFRPVEVQRHIVERAFAFACFTVLLTANVTFFMNAGPIPMHSAVSAAMLVLCATVFPNDAYIVLKRNILVFALAGGLALQGSLVSLVNGATPRDIVQAVMEVHVQAAIVLIAAATLAQVCGARACVIAIVAVIGASAAVGVLQMLHIDLGWALRKAVGPLAMDDVADKIAERRPSGLAYSPIQLATHVCLAFAAYTAVRDKGRRFTSQHNSADPAILAALFFFFVTCFASGTRAPIMGGFIFLALYTIFRRGSWLPLMLMLGGLLVYMIWPFIMEAIQNNAPRVARVDDTSAATRVVFAYYGVRLFIDNPLGYGLTFDPTLLWSHYWRDLYLMNGAQGAQVHPLHDYVLSMLNTYGFGILLFAPLVVKLLRASAASLIFFVPYIIQILFHNSGPFYNDMVLWFVVGAIAAVGTTGALDPMTLVRIPVTRTAYMRAAINRARGWRAPARPGWNSGQ